MRKTATGAAIPHISRKALERIVLPTIDFKDQLRIAYLLNKVEGLIAKRKQHLQQLDDLLKSVFLTMFGAKNPDYGTWPLVEIKELAAKHKGAMRTGPFGSNLLHSEFNTEGDVAVLGIDNAVQNRFAWGERRFITNEKYKGLESYRVFPGDVIVTIMGTIGRSAVIPDNIPLAINTKHLAAITVNREIADPIFLSYSIHSSPYVINQFKNKTRGAIMSGLNLTIIKETKIRRPPIEDQNKFAAVHVLVDSIKSHYGQSLLELENLYGALSQKAFKGDLDLSRIDVPRPSQARKLEEITEEQKVIEESNKNLRHFHASLPPSGAASDIDNTIRQLDTELKVRGVVPFWDEYVKYRILINKLNGKFSYPELMNEINKFPFEEKPTPEKLRSFLLSLLEGERPFIEQVFDVSETQKKERITTDLNPEVMFRVINEA